jgi:hypothetical protein
MSLVYVCQGEAALVNGTLLLSAHSPTAPMYVKSESSMAVACRSAMVEGRVRWEQCDECECWQVNRSSATTVNEEQGKAGTVQWMPTAERIRANLPCQRGQWWQRWWGISEVRLPRVNNLGNDDLCFWRGRRQTTDLWDHSAHSVLCFTRGKDTRRNFLIGQAGCSLNFFLRRN